MHPVAAHVPPLMGGPTDERLLNSGDQMMLLCRPDDERSGQMMIFFVVILLLLFCVAVLAVDVGKLTVSKSTLQNASDAGSLSALLQHWRTRAAEGTRSEARVDGAQEAVRIASSNYSGVGVKPRFGRWQDGTFTEVGTELPANAVMLDVFRNANAPGGPVETFFAGMLGRNTIDQRTLSVAHFEHRGLMPFAAWEGNMVDPGQTMIFYNDTEVAPGVFGTMNYDGGDNSASELKLWAEEGYRGVIYIDPAQGYLWVEGSTGLKSALSNPIGQHIKTGDTVVGCIYREVTGKASNAQFKLVGFFSMVIVEQKLKNEEYEYIKGQVKGIYYAETGDTEGDMWGLMRLRLVQ